MKTAEEILKEKLATSLAAGKSSSEDRSTAILQAMEEYADQFKPKWIRAVANPENEDLDIEGLEQGQLVDIWTPNHGTSREVEYNGGVSFYDHYSTTEYLCCEDEVWYMLIPESPKRTEA
jgi:hypothetical protein